MWSTFITTLKMSLRNKPALFWLIVFPIALSTLFTGVFGNLDEGYEIKPISLAVVEDTRLQNAVVAKMFINAIAGKATQSENYADLDTQLIDATSVDSVDSARTAIADNAVYGYLSADTNGRLQLTLSSDIATSGTSTGSSYAVTIAALDGAMRLYNQTDAAIRDIIEHHPEAVASRAFWSSISNVTTMTHEVQLTNFKPDVMARYFYAMLGMACLMAMGFSISAVTTAQANLSALGIRRTVAPLSRIRQLLAGFFASWLCSGVSLMIALAYIRYVCGIELGGREPAAALAVVVASFMACAFGTMIGAIPKLPHSVKIGLTSAIPCTLSLFSGLYGGFAMTLSDWIARNAPVLAIINPAQQVTNLFYGLLYYDSYRPFAGTCGILIAMSAIFLIAGVIMLKEQRYEHL